MNLCWPFQRGNLAKTMLVTIKRKSCQTKEHDWEGMKEKFLQQKGLGCNIAIYILDNTCRSFFLIVLFLYSLKQCQFLISLIIKLNWCFGLLYTAGAFYSLNVCDCTFCSAFKEFFGTKLRSTSNISLKGRSIT